MAQTEVNASPFVPNHSLSHLSSPLPKKTRLSLRRTTRVLHKPCYKEEDASENKKDTNDLPDDISGVEMIDLTQDENTSPNCASSTEEKLDHATLLKVQDSSEIKPSVLGLPNCGNTCYVNSILQVLRFTPGFLNSLHILLLIKHHLSKLPIRWKDDAKEKGKELFFFKQLHLLYTAMKRKEASMKTNTEKDYCKHLEKPVMSVINSLREVTMLFEEGEQNDAHELLITTIDAFSTACQSLKNVIKKEDGNDSPGESSPDTGPSTPTSVPDIAKQEPPAPKRRKTKASTYDYSSLDKLNLGFEGKIRHVVQCLECEKRLEKEESFTNLEVSIPEKSNSEEPVDLKQFLSQTTILSGENKFFCEECQHYNEAKMSSEVVELPPILLIHCSWHKSSEPSSASKTSHKVSIPRTLSTSENADVFPTSPHHTYRLFAVILHISLSASKGHYVSFIRDAASTTSTSGSSPPRSSCPATEEGEVDPFAPKLRAASQFIGEARHCCTTAETTADFTAPDVGPTSNRRWLFFDDDLVSPLVVDEEPETFPYYNFLSLNASPCMLFYHRT